ncbi:MAG: hypothetical protein H6Q30_2710, partial [Bacteroidetes bacterium]|nr:hypothetical protein [Bacteroidota bacterium]
ALLGAKYQLIVIHFHAIALMIIRELDLGRALMVVTEKGARS